MRKVAIDTNILARLLAKEASVEASFAEALLLSAVIFVSKTVLLETEWILRGVMRIERSRVNEMIGSMLELASFDVEEAENVKIALIAHRGGMDFSDALHVISAQKADCFITFDRALVKYATRHFPNAGVELAS